MNKFLTALVVGALSVSAFAQTALVYDYKASVKRINPVISTIKYSAAGWDAKKNDTTKKLESYSVVSDTLKGYLVLEACSTCAADGWEEFNAETNTVSLYITRSGDKKKLVWGFENATVEGAVFSKGVGNRAANAAYSSLNEKSTSLKNIKSAWMALSYESTKYGYNTSNTAYGADKYPTYGLLGEDYQSVEIDHAGFGKAVGGSSTTVIDGGICGESSSTTEGCVRIDSISGTLVGSAEIAGPCSTPMWDACVLTIENSDSGKVNEVAVSGTWSIKLNKKLTKVANDASVDVDDAYIIKALKGVSASAATGFAQNVAGVAWDDAIIDADGE